MRQLKAKHAKPSRMAGRAVFLRLFAGLKKIALCVLVLCLTALTPIFAWVVGGMLSLVGELYGRDARMTAPNMYVVVGGGLTKRVEDGTVRIVLNDYSRLRTEALWQHLSTKPLPVLTSGVESPWMVESLVHFSDDTTKLPVIVSENASMNTCENVQFTVKLIHYERAAATLPDTEHIYLVSDWYHMARLRRHFAHLGIATTPIVSKMPKPLSWTDPKSNLNHARRAFYESVALFRDVFSSQTGCRSADSVSIETLKTPRKSVKTF